MLQNDVRYGTAMKPSYFSKELLLVFLKKHFFAITLTWPKTQFTEKTLIFSKTVD